MTLSHDPIQTTEIPPTTCPACGHLIEAITGTGIPTAGSITLCAYCRTFLILDAQLQQRVLSNAEWAALPFDQRQHLTWVRDGLPSTGLGGPR